MVLLWVGYWGVYLINRGMIKEKFVVANLKCNGCASTIKSELLQTPGIFAVEVNLEQDSVTVDYEKIVRDTVVKQLLGLGYPEATEKNGLLLQLKSYSSCLTGKVKNQFKH